jgi:N-acetylglutamate synthase-like GNAT family acetyltransferase
LQSFHIQRLGPEDRAFVQRFVAEHWGAELIVTRGRVVYPAALPGFVALDDRGRRIGLVTHEVLNGKCEVITLDAIEKNKGIGTALLEEVIRAARALQCKVVWLITTNDNLKAQGFYRRRGFKTIAIHRGAVIESRKLKPSIPEIGSHGIPIEDEVEMAIQLEPSPADQPG